MTTVNREYTGSCYAGVVGGETEVVSCRDSISKIIFQEGDSIRFIQATKGYEARQSHFDFWLKETEHPFMFLMDADQVFSPKCLQQLRSYKLPYVSGFYMRRRFDPIAPVWYKAGNGEFPFHIWDEPIEMDKLYPLDAAGWGCILIHRDVAEKTAELLKGETFVLEDDMDVYPYDLKKIMACIRKLKTFNMWRGTTASAVIDEVLKIQAVLEQEIRPLRGVKDIVGSDLRFPFFARKAGFQLYGSTHPDACCSHMLNYPLSAFDYTQLLPENYMKLQQAVGNDRKAEMEHLEKAMQDLMSDEVVL